MLYTLWQFVCFLFLILVAMILLMFIVALISEILSNIVKK